MRANGGVEGFFAAMSQALAPFKIGVTIVEPGGARANFRFGDAQVGREMQAYEGTPVDMGHGCSKILPAFRPAIDPRWRRS